MLKKILFSILINGALCFASGTTVGNGGVGVYCPMTVGQYQSMMILDFWESSALGGIRSLPRYESKSYLEVARMKLAMLDKKSAVDFKKVTQIFLQLKAHWKFLPEGTHMALTGDVDTILSPPFGCQFVQVVNFGGDGSVYVDREYWDYMDTANQAALFLHEVIYKYLRDSARGDEGSALRTRRFIASLFASNQLERPPVWNQVGGFYCYSEANVNYSSFFVGKTSLGVEIDFEYLNGHRVLDRSFVRISSSLKIVDFDRLPFTSRVSSVVDSDYFVSIHERTESLGQVIEIRDARHGRFASMPYTCSKN